MLVLDEADEMLNKGMYNLNISGIVCFMTSFRDMFRRF